MLLSRPSAASRAVVSPKSHSGIAVAQMKGEFRVEAHGTFAPIGVSTTHSTADTESAPPDAGDDELARLLAAIADEVRSWAAGARTSIAAEFSGRISHAQRHLPKHEVLGAVRALKEACQAALAAITRIAQAELLARREAVIRARRRPRNATRRSPRPKSLDGPTKT